MPLTDTRYLIATDQDYPPWIPTRHGPFAYGGSLYVVFPTVFPAYMTVYRSTDDGETWTEQSSSGAPEPNDGGLVKNYSVIRDGSQLVVSFVDALTDCIQLGFFSLTANAWTSPSSTGPAGQRVNWVMDDGGHYKSFVCKHTATGRHYVLYQGAPEGTFERVWLTYWDGSSWSSPASVLEPGLNLDCTPTGLIEDSLGNLHMFATAHDRATLETTLYVKSIDTGLTVGSAAVVTSNISRGVEPRTNAPIATADGTILVSFRTYPTNTALAIATASPGAPLSWTIDTVTGADPNDDYMGADVVADGSNTLYAIWQRDYYQLWYSSKPLSGGVWSDPAQFAEYEDDTGEHVLAALADGRIMLTFAGEDDDGRYFLDFSGTDLSGGPRARYYAVQ